MIRHKAPWDARSTISRSAHVLERIGLALTGASCGLFVAAHVGRAEIDLIGSARSASISGSIFRTRLPTMTCICR
jgi:hypothetical protein